MDSSTGTKNWTFKDLHRLKGNPILEEEERALIQFVSTIELRNCFLEYGPNASENCKGILELYWKFRNAPRKS